MHRPAAGDRISNYLLDERIGSGSFGEVWKAHHHVFPEIVAVKIPTDPQFVRNLRQEGVAIRGLHHPNIVRAIDLDPYAEVPYLIMEYVDGPSLREVLRERSGGIPAASALAVMEGLLLALEAAHAAGVIHRDVKPENILVAGGNGLEGMVPDRVKVADFGLGSAGGLTTASMLQSGSLVTEQGKSIAGTLAYMSPEQREGRPIDARSDLYSCGIVLFEMLTGDRPAGNDLPSRIRPEVPAWLDAVFEKLYTRYDRRFASAQEVLAAIRPSVRAASAGADGVRRVRGAAGWQCRACRGAVADDDQFCIHCGVQLVERVPRCTVCEAYVHKGDRYCILCGEELRAT